MVRTYRSKWPFVISFLLASILACQGYKLEQNDTSDRIHGGQQAIPGQFPYQVALLYRNRQNCGGSLVVHPDNTDYQFVVTAAHCLYDSETKQWRQTEDFRIMAGSIDKRNRKNVAQVTEYVIHRDYKPGRVGSPADIAILKFSRRFVLSQYIQPIALDNPSWTFGRRNLTISGWGRTEVNTRPQILRYVDVPEISYNRCRELSGSSVDRSAHICVFAKNLGSCRGDSGGPAVRKRYRGWFPPREILVLRGIVSWGGWNEEEKRCLTDTRPSVLTSVPHFYSWILQNSR